MARDGLFDGLSSLPHPISWGSVLTGVQASLGSIAWSFLVAHGVLLRSSIGQVSIGLSCIQIRRVVWDPLPGFRKRQGVGQHLLHH